jgi:S1-C subfamily serine protease
VCSFKLRLSPPASIQETRALASPGRYNIRNTGLETVIVAIAEKGGVIRRKIIPHIRFRAFARAGLVLAVALSGPIAAGQPTEFRYSVADLKALQETFVRLAEEVLPSVVAIRTYRTHNSEDPENIHVRIPLSQGSGFIIGADGFIATNRHVVESANAITVRTFDGVVHDAKLWQSDPRSDLAVLKIEADHLKTARWGELAEVRVNQWAFACGNPFGLANDDGRPSITYGVISAMGRQMTRRLVGDSDVAYYGNLLETSAAINPGNSGGPLFNISGEVIGVVTAIETASGVSEGRGFAIPVDKNTRRILATLKAGQPVRYGFLGIEVEEVENGGPLREMERRAFRGALISRIRVPNGPAALAGLMANDIVIEFDGVTVESADHLVRLVGFTPVGTEAELTYLRGGLKRRATVTLGDRLELLHVGALSD